MAGRTKWQEPLEHWAGGSCTCLFQTLQLPQSPEYTEVAKLRSKVQAQWQPWSHWWHERIANLFRSGHQMSVRHRTWNLSKSWRGESWYRVPCQWAPVEFGIRCCLREKTKQNEKAVGFSSGERVCWQARCSDVLCVIVSVWHISHRRGSSPSSCFLIHWRQMSDSVVIFVEIVISKISLREVFRAWLWCSIAWCKCRTFSLSTHQVCVPVPANFVRWNVPAANNYL